MVLVNLSRPVCFLLVSLCLLHSKSVWGWCSVSGRRIDIAVKPYNSNHPTRCLSSSAHSQTRHSSLFRYHQTEKTFGNTGNQRSPCSSLKMNANNNNNDDKSNKKNQNTNERGNSNHNVLQSIQTLIQSGLSIFITNLWKGLALPFPKLGSILEKERQQNNRTLGITESLLFIVIYLLLGVGAYSFVLPSTEWSIIDSLYFCVVSFTTVGYGDLTPSTFIGKLFTIAFALGGVAFLGVALATLGTNLVQAELVAVEKAKKASRMQIMDFFNKMPQLVKKQKLKGDKEALLEASKATTTTTTTTSSDESSNTPQRNKSKRREIVEKVLPFVISLTLGGLAIGHMEGWPWWDSLYFSMITASTVGYGDLSPTLPQTRLLSVVLLPLAVAAAGDVLGSIASLFLERLRNSDDKESQEEELTMERIQLMDSNGDGRVSKREYIEFMLLEMKLVDQEQLDDLHDQFERLDVSQSGFLEKQDIEIMARLRIQKEKNVF